MLFYRSQSYGFSLAYYQWWQFSLYLAGSYQKSKLEIGWIDY